MDRALVICSTMSCKLTQVSGVPEVGNKAEKTFLKNNSWANHKQTAEHQS